PLILRRLQPLRKGPPSVRAQGQSSLRLGSSLAQDNCREFFRVISFSLGQRRPSCRWDFRPKRVHARRPDQAIRDERRVPYPSLLSASQAVARDLPPLASEWLREQSRPQAPFSWLDARRAAGL